MVRIGIGLYGLWPSKETQEAFQNKINLQPVLTWKTIVTQIKHLPKGSRIGYDLTEILHQPSRVAVLPIGYWHGFPRSLSSRGYVLINGCLAKVLGRVSMDMATVDVTKIKKIQPGEEVVLLGKSGKKVIKAEEFASLAGTINYEIVTRLNPLMKRFVI
jgi:alanine racemase